MPSNGGQRLIRGLLDEWRRRGWRDRDDAAVIVARGLMEGRTASEATSLVTRTMLDANGIGRSELEASVLTVAARQSSPSTSEFTVVVLTAIELEFQAVRAELSNVRTVHTEHGTEYHVGHLTGPSSTCSVGVARIGPGNIGAATEVAAAVQLFRPSAVLFVGVAGGVKRDLEIGDVVFASRVHYYEGGRAEAEQFMSRPLSFPTSHRLAQLAAAVGREFPVTVHIKPIAAGEVLIASSRSDVAKIVNAHYNDTVAVDMESAGVYDAAHRLEVSALAIRGISDRLDDKSVGADLQNQPTAARNAANFMAALLSAEGASGAFGRGR